ncbi:MAG TPA: YceI family protein [Methylibium sp.]|uniref:YceI family protein n=1 Tax=Methylibium sp. TaxID=2067992 RepID=UPI002DB99AB0|nr:YceI family protein [Methylibium sp.]HEU4459006.1 YceI family protein [Methylibium sp.]
MNRAGSFVAAFCLAASLAQAQTPAARSTPAAKLVPEQSEIGFVSRQMGVPVEGRFRKFAANVVFDPKKPEASSITINIDTSSATIGDKDTDAEMPKAPWFAVAKFPTATFESSAIKPAGAGKFEVAGKLSIKGVSQNIVVPVALAQTGTTSTATGSFAIKRNDFKIGEGEWADTSMVANEVQVKFKLTLTGIAPL